MGRTSHFQLQTGVQYCTPHGVPVGDAEEFLDLLLAFQRAALQALRLHHTTSCTTFPKDFLRHRLLRSWFFGLDQMLLGLFAS
mmetsp:Transcript_42254/g.109601  ORF Transcript_42254/g.109601 Transcript_42254/m.109601 type:complete len:83 (+) Transcript_42254:402-650(+)